MNQKRTSFKYKANTLISRSTWMKIETHSFSNISFVWLSIWCSFCIWTNTAFQCEWGGNNAAYKQNKKKLATHTHSVQLYMNKCVKWKYKRADGWNVKRKRKMDYSNGTLYCIQERYTPCSIAVHFYIFTPNRVLKCCFILLLLSMSFATCILFVNHFSVLLPS